MTRYKGICECFDLGCPKHKGKEICPNKGRQFVYRIDMEDITGIFMCLTCAEDAYESGLFSNKRNFYS